jgi:hypothetical protein
VGAIAGDVFVDADQQQEKRLLDMLMAEIKGAIDLD